MKLRNRTIAVVVLVLALAMAAIVPALAQGTAPQSALRVVHAVPGGPAVNVLVDNNTVFSNISYKQVTSYVALPAGPHSVRVVAAGTQQVLFDTPVSLNGNTYNTVGAVGQPNSVQPLVMNNENTLPVPNQARVRVVHASPNAPAVDLAVAGGAVLFSNVSFPSASGYMTVNAQTFNVEIRQAGTSNVVLTVPNVTLSGATVYSIWAVGLVNGQPPLEALVVVDAPPVLVCQTVVATQTPGPTGVVGGVAGATGTPAATGTRATNTPTPSGTRATGTPTTGTPTTTTGTPTVTGTRATGTPTTAAGTPTATTGTPAATGTAATTAPTVATTAPTVATTAPTAAATAAPTGAATAAGGGATSAPSTPAGGGATTVPATP